MRQTRYRAHRDEASKRITEAVTAVQRELKDQPQVALRAGQDRQGRKQVELLLDKNGKPRATLIRRADRTLEGKGALRPYDLADPNFDPEDAPRLYGTIPDLVDLQTEQIGEAFEKLVKKYLKGTKLSMLVGIIAIPDWFRGSNHHFNEARNSVKWLSNQCWTKAELSSGRVRERERTHSVGSLVNRHIMFEFKISPKDVQLAMEWFDDHSNPALREQLTIDEYNFTIRNKDSLAQLEEQSPAVIRWYTRTGLYKNWPETFRTARGKPVKPSQVIERVRKDTGLDEEEPARWKAFLTTPLQRIGRHRFTRFSNVSAAEREAARRNARERLQEQLVSYTEMLARANPSPKHAPDDYQLGQLWNCEHHTQQLKAKEWSHGDPMAAWANIVQAYLEDSENERNGEIPRRYGTTLSDVGDALQAAIEAQEPWPTGARWPDHKAKSERWHTRMVAEARERREKERATASWTAPVQQASMKGHQAKALTTPKQLSIAGSELHNCLDSYWQRCLKGQALIYLISEEKENAPVAAAELHKPESRGQWEPGQVRLAKNNEAPAWMTVWARELAEACNDAELTARHQAALAENETAEATATD